MSFFTPRFDRPGIGPENEPPRSAFYLFFRHLTTNFYALVGLNLLLFLLALPLYVWLTTLFNIIAVEHGAGVPGMLAAVILYYLPDMPPWLGILLFLASALAWGPACAGLTYVTYRFSAGDHAWPFSDFWDAAKANWKQAVPTGLLDLLVTYATLNYLFSEDYAGMAAIRVLWYFLLLVYLCCRVFIYPLMVNVQAPWIVLVKDAFILGAVSVSRVFAVLLAAAVLLILSGYLDFVILPVFSYAFFSFFTCALVHPVLDSRLN